MTKSAQDSVTTVIDASHLYHNKKGKSEVFNLLAVCNIVVVIFRITLPIFYFLLVDWFGMFTFQKRPIIALLKKHSLVDF